MSGSCLTYAPKVFEVVWGNYDDNSVANTPVGGQESQYQANDINQNQLMPL